VNGQHIYEWEMSVCYVVFSMGSLWKVIN